MMPVPDEVAHLRIASRTLSPETVAYLRPPPALHAPAPAPLAPPAPPRWARLRRALVAAWRLLLS